MILVALGVAPLGFWPGFGDGYTEPKWIALTACVAAWLALAACRRSDLRQVPRLPLAFRALVVLLAVSWLLDAWRLGLGQTLASLLDRVTWVAVTLLVAGFLWRARGTAAALRAAAAAACLVSLAGGLVRLAAPAAAPLSWGERLAGPFGNPNLAAEYVGFAAVLLVATGRPGQASEWGSPVAGLAVGLVVALGSRSALLALACGLGVALWRRAGARRQAFALAIAGLATLALVAAWPAGPPVEAGKAVAVERSARWPLLAHDKQRSEQVRATLWRHSLELVADHPFGVGLGQFEPAIAAYFAGEPLFAEATFRSPHSELLRLLAEQGVVVGAGVMMLLLAPFAAGIRPQHPPALPDARRPAAALTAYAVVQALLQFPLETAPGVVLLGTTFGYGLVALAPKAPEPTEGAARRGFSDALRRAGLLLLAAALLLGRGRLAFAEHLHGACPGDAAAQERACRLDPRHVRACTTAAYLHARAGQSVRARCLLRGVLERTPHEPAAIQLLAEVRLAAGDVGAGCAYLEVYRSVMGVAGSADRPAFGACSAPRADDAAAPTRFDRFPFDPEDRRLECTASAR